MSFRTPFRMITAAAIAALALGAGAARAYTAAVATASADEYTLLCSTCSIDFYDLGTVQDGGPGAASAFADHSGAGYSGVASVTFDPGDGLPQLGAYAFADELYDGLRTHLYKAFAEAQGLQTYVYGGSGPMTYTIEYTIDGEFFLNFPDAASPMQVYGGLTVYKDPYTPYAEVHPNYGYDYQGENASVAGTAPFLLSGSVTFTVNPGDVFTVSGTLTAYADATHQVTGSTDALHTLAMDFSAGEVSLLTPELVAVPEPSTLLLLGGGLVWLATFGARDRARGGAGTVSV